MSEGNSVKIEGLVPWDVRGTDKVTNFHLSVISDKRGRTSNIACVAWSSDVAGVTIRKGGFYRLEGRITTSSYQNKEGKTVYTTQCVAERLEEIRGMVASQQPKASSPQSFGDIRQAVRDDENPF